MILRCRKILEIFRIWWIFPSASIDSHLFLKMGSSHTFFRPTWWSTKDEIDLWNSIAVVGTMTEIREKIHYRTCDYIKIMREFFIEKYFDVDKNYAKYFENSYWINFTWIDNMNVWQKNLANTTGTISHRETGCLQSSAYLIFSPLLF